MNDLADDDSITLSLSNLPRLTLKDIENADDCCPICLIPYRTILEQLVEDGENNCVTKIEGCGHVFCIQDLSEWIRGRHGTCPTCRHPFLPDLRPVDSDDESSDGGEYVPTEYDADTDYGSDAEEGLFDSDDLDVETMEVGMDVDVQSAECDETWNDGDSVHDGDVEGIHGQCGQSSDIEWWDEAEEGEEGWGLTDGESMSASEGEIMPSDRLSEAEAESEIQVRLNSEGEYAIEDGSVAKR